MLAAMRRKMADPALTPKELLQLLKHEERLSKELKAVAAEKIRTKLAALDGNRYTTGLRPARQGQCGNGFGGRRIFVSIRPILPSAM